MQAEAGSPMNDCDLNERLAPKGTLRVVINTGNAILTRPSEGDGPAGVSVDLARDFASRRGLPVAFQVVSNAAAAVALVAEEQADLGFFAVDPARSGIIAFTNPWILIEGWYLVRENSPLTTVEEVDRSCHRIAVGRGSAYDLHLSRVIEKATLERVTTSQEVVDFFLREGLDVAAGVRQQLEADQQRIPGLRLLPDRFMVIRQALGIPEARGDELVALLNDYLTEAKESQRISQLIELNRAEGALVA